MPGVASAVGGWRARHRSTAVALNAGLRVAMSATSHVSDSNAMIRCVSFSSVHARSRTTSAVQDGGGRKTPPSHLFPSRALRGRAYRAYSALLHRVACEECYLSLPSAAGRSAARRKISTRLRWKCGILVYVLHYLIFTTIPPEHHAEMPTIPSTAAFKHARKQTAALLPAVSRHHLPIGRRATRNLRPMR